MLRYTYKNIYIYGNKNKQAIGAASTVGRSWESVPPQSSCAAEPDAHSRENREKYLNFLLGCSDSTSCILSI